MLSRFRYCRALNHIFSLAAELNRQDVKTIVVITDCPVSYRDQLRHYQQHFPCFTESRPEEIIRLIRYFRIELLHLHDLSLINTTQRLLRSWPIPCGITLHDQLPPAINLSSLPGLSFLITPYPVVRGIPARLQSKTFFIPEGIDLQAYRPMPKEGFKIAFILEEGGSTGEGSAALLKATGLANLDLELICPQPLPLLKGRYYGWLLNSSAVLGRSQVVIGRYRGLLEGMACGNAALIMGRSYNGIFNSRQYPAALSFPDLSGEGDEPPCYRSIFFDLSTLLKDRPLLESLQQQNRRFIRENCDLRLIAEQTAGLYRQITSG
jgi:hypothetical protein